MTLRAELRWCPGCRAHAIGPRLILCGTCLAMIPRAGKVELDRIGREHGFDSEPYLALAARVVNRIAYGHQQARRQALDAERAPLPPLPNADDPEAIRAQLIALRQALEEA